jgi:F-type H+-transporting ATPase subunit b
MRAAAQEESARIVARGEEQLAVQRQLVVRELRAEIGTLATDLAERVVGESLADDQTRQRTVDRFLEDLEGMARSVPAGVATGDRAGAAGGPGESGPAAAGSDQPASPSDAPAGATRAEPEDDGGRSPFRRR